MIILKMTKKIMLIMFVAIIGFFVVDFLGLSDIRGNDYQESTSWQGEDIGFIPQLDVSYESAYVPFSVIYHDPLLIDNSKIYVIENAEDLYFLSRASREDYRVAFMALDYVLGNHIDYYEIVQQNIDNRFVPIGFIEPFNGTFDGQGYEITNLFYQTIMSEDSYNNDYFGLRFYSMFSKIGTTGVIKNFGLINPIMIQPIEWGIMNHASFIAGENRGLIENVYVRDTRGVSSGMSVEGEFHLSGLVSINYGTVNQAYLATPHVRGIAVLDYQSTNVGFYQNTGVIANVYYDTTIYEDTNATNNYITPLSTTQFLNHSLFSDDWFFSDSYHSLTTNPNEYQQITLNHTYPILQGLDVENGKLLIKNAVDLSYMNTLLKFSGFFRNAYYELIHDIDMNGLASDNYQAADVAFNGTLSSRLVTIDSVLYPRFSSQGGNPNYHTILNLSIEKGIVIGVYTSYALFPSLFGHVENLNFVNLTIDALDIDDASNMTKVLVGSIAGQMNEGSISNVHILGDIFVPQSTLPTTKLYVGGLVAEGNGSISQSSTNGNLTVDTQIYDVKSNQSAVAGLIGKTTGIEIFESINNMSILSFGYTTPNDSTVYIGGLIGHGNIRSLNRSMNSGHIASTKIDSYQKNIFLGGIIGKQTSQMTDISHIFNNGNIDLYINQAMNAKLNGYGYFEFDSQIQDQETDMLSITNSGRIRTLYPDGFTFSSSDLALMNIEISGIYAGSGIEALFKGFFNNGDIIVDPAIVSKVAGTLILENQSNSTLIHAYQTGNITLTTMQNMNRISTKIAGIALGEHISYDHLRNEGPIAVTINHNTLMTSGTLSLNGLFDVLSNGHVASNLFNGGDLSVIQGAATTIALDIYLSGINQVHDNPLYYTNLNMNYQSVNRLNEHTGSIYNALNDGDLTVSGSFNGSSYVSGITFSNGGLLTQAINLGHIKNENNTTKTDGIVASAGLSYLLSSGYGQIKDSANYGKIEAIQTGTLGQSLSAGLVVRNDLNQNLNTIQTSDNNRFSKIVFSINYGDVYAHNGASEIANTVASNSKNKAAGIIANGSLTVINTINYGDIHANYTAGGIFGFLDFQSFGNYSQNQVYVGNNQNYGKIRKIDGYASDYQVNYYALPLQNTYESFGGFVAKFHTGTATWEFLSASPTDSTPLDQINFGYFYNFDTIVNVLGQAPSTTMNPDLAEDVIGNDVLISIISELGTLKSLDASPSPFNVKQLGSWPKTGFYGQRIKTYTNDDTPDGMYFGNFVLRSLPIYNYGSRQYLKNFFTYVKRDDINPVLLSNIEFNQSHQVFGLYAISSSLGVSEGILIPDHFDLSSLNPQYANVEPDTSWLGSDLDINSVLYKFTKGMRQINLDTAVTIYDLEIEQVDINGNPVSNGLVLRSPEISEERRLITYYLPSNATIINNVPSQTLTTYSFVEAGTNLGTMIPETYENGVWTYKWVGDYIKDGENYSPIGHYHSSGIYNPTFSPTATTYYANNRNQRVPHLYDRIPTAANNPMNFIFDAKIYNRTGTGNATKWNGTGYRVIQANSPVAPGYGMYREYEPYDPYPPSYNDIGYEYVGPTQYEVTYIQTNPTPTTVYNQTSIQFNAKLTSDAYKISQGSSFDADGTPVTDFITIPRSYGVYDVLYDGNGQSLDTLEEHYGMVRIYAPNYSAENPTAYRDYQIRIIRTADQNLTGLDVLNVDGTNALPSPMSNFLDVTATKDIYYKEENELGSMIFNYRILNSYNGYNVLPLIKIYDLNNSLAEVDPSLYRLYGGIVINTNDFNNLTGVWGEGYFEATLTISDMMKASDYLLELTLMTGETALINFTKAPSNEAKIREMTFRDDIYTIDDGITNITHEIPYGIYYNTSDPFTSFVNFTNLSSLVNINFNQLIGSNLPSYLQGLVISPYSTIESIDIEIDDTLQSRYQYIITYHILAEDGVTSTDFVHRLQEIEPVSQANFIYLNGGEIERPIPELYMRYNDAPTLRLEYALNRIYFSPEEMIDVSVDFIPSLGEMMAAEDLDYFIRPLYGIGTEVDFNQQIPIGAYTISASFSREVTVLGEILTWQTDFESVTIIKLKNDDSLLKNIMFVSETVFAGFDTIVDVTEIDELNYVNYLMYPSSRIINVLPTTGIYYGSYDNYQTYWIIGQVQRTNLTAYQPTFEIPDYAKIRRVVDFENNHYDYQSTNLYADFTVYEEGFNFILYRVYAHDYDENPNHYTDYYVSVQDVTNNIKFNLTVINETDTVINRVFVRIKIYPYGDDYSGEYDDNLMQASMSTFSYYDDLTDTYLNPQFQTTMGGTYALEVDLPEGFRYEVELQALTITGGGFYLESSILPRKYYVTVRIYDDTIPEIPWGLHREFDYEPQLIET